MEDVARGRDGMGTAPGALGPSTTTQGEFMNHLRSMAARPAPVALALFIASMPALAQVTLDFSDAISGRRFYAYDADLNGTLDVVLSTADLGGFNTLGPGSNMLYIHEPGIEGTTHLPEDLRVNFFYGATGEVSFGYALDTFNSNYGVSFTVFDVNGNPLGTTVSSASFQPLPGGGQSSFPENRATLVFSGVAAYGTFDFGISAPFTPPAGCPPIPVPGSLPPCGPSPGPDFPPPRYIIDDLTMTFAGTSKLPGYDGVVASDPVLPQALTPGPGGVTQFDFNLVPSFGGAGVAFPIFVDPALALGYTYRVKSGPNVAAVLIPQALAHGDASFVLEIDGVGSFALQAGVEFDLLALNPAGFSSFRIVGIDPSEALDPNDPQAFVTGLRFVSAGAVSLSQQAITSVPEPAMAWLLAGGLGLLALRRRGREGAALRV
jgi:hypothetical protein